MVLQQSLEIFQPVAAKQESIDFGAEKLEGDI